MLSELLMAQTMFSNETIRIPRKRSAMWLKLAVHFDAACRAPRAYLIAMWWHLCGKRLRARAQLAPLLATSPRAYRLWLLNEKSVGEWCDPGGTGPMIVALIEVGAGQGILDKTLRSLSDEGVVALVIGTKDIPTPAAAARRINWSAGAWLMPLRAGDLLAPGATSAYRAATKLDVRVVYADDDLLDANGARMAPHFKPSWNSELFRHFDYLTGGCIVRAVAQDLHGLSGSDWAQQLVGAVASEGAAVHIPRVLHHRRSRPRPRVPTVFEAGAALPVITVIVPTRNRPDLLQTCLRGIEQTDYPDLEVIVVDNDSDDPAAVAYLAGLDRTQCRVLRHPGPFNFSAINNRAVNEARGGLLCLLNNDTEVIEPGWLRIMATQALREDVGAVGARLLYPDGRIQHAGVVLGVGGGAAHAHRLLDPKEEGYFRRHALPQFVSAVTAACLVVSRERYLAVGGFDEKNFAVAFNDVDFCMRLNRKGWQSLYEPRATLIHHESVSRGFDRDPVGSARLEGELMALKQLWETSAEVDPFHHPQLSPSSERFVLRL
jgi:O-antigen biosynthesis protein